MRRWTRFCLLFLLVCTACTVAHSTTRRVPSQFPSIQGAIDASSDGDTVLVAPNTYTGDGNRDLDFHGADLVLCSESGPEATVIDSEGSEGNHHRALHFHNDETSASVVEGLTLRNGMAIGGGILCSGEASPIIRSCIISDNRSTDVAGADPGAGIVCADFASPLIEDCTVTRNEGCQGGASGIVCLDQSTPEIRNCVISDNDCGGIVILDESAPMIVGCQILGNFGIYGAGIWSRSTESLEVVESVLALNYAIVGGGGIADHSPAGGHLRILNCTIVNNRAVESVGGGISCDETMMEVERTVIWGNCAKAGDQIYLRESLALLTCCVVDSGGIGIDPSSAVNYVDALVFSDPLLCDPLGCMSAPTLGGSYSVSSTSPCIPPNSPCGEQIGALGEGCEETPVLETTWGCVKAGFR